MSTCIFDLIFSAPENPEGIRVDSQSPSHIELSWIQKGVVTNYSIVVLNEENSNYTISWENTVEDEYTAVINDLSVPGKSYNISITAFSEERDSNAVTTSAVTRKLCDDVSN